MVDDFWANPNGRALSAVKRVFPGENRRCQIEHPIFHCFYDSGKPQVLCPSRNSKSENRRHLGA